jgi:TonB-dependent starch-binding outer membrane protein SusC
MKKLTYIALLCCLIGASVQEALASKYHYTICSSPDTLPPIPIRGTYQGFESSQSSKGVTTLLQGNQPHPLLAMQGLNPGMVISRPGGDPNSPIDVQIRGLHSALYAGAQDLPTAGRYSKAFDYTQPLVVIDGMPGLDLQSVDFRDIEKIEVLRDAASLAQYGMRGANGAILVTTKGGQRKNGFNYQVGFGMETPARMYEPLDATSYRNLVKPGGKYAGAGVDLGQNTNWLDQITRTGFNQQHQLAWNLGIKNGGIRLSANYLDTKGVAKNSDYQAASTRLSFNRYFGERKVEISGNLAYQWRQSSEINPDMFRQAASLNPTAPIRSDTSTRYGGYFQPNAFALYNPVATLNMQTRDRNVGTLNGVLNAKWNLNKNISVYTRNGYQNQRSTFGFSSSRFLPQQNPIASWEDFTLGNWFSENGVQLNKNIKKNTIKLNLGRSDQGWNGENEFWEATAFGQGDADYVPLKNQTYGQLDWKTNTITERENDRLIAYFGGLNYTFDDRWALNARVRREGFSRLADNNKWHTFYGASASAKLLENEKGDQLTLRLSYGQAGNIPPKNYASRVVVTPSGTVLLNGSFQSGVQIAHEPNPNLGPEIRRELDLGLDFTLLAGKLNGTFNVYSSRSSDLLWQYNVNVNQSTLSTLRFENGGEMNNRGIELQLNYTAQVGSEKSGIRWSSNLVLNHNRTFFGQLPSNNPGEQASIPVGSLGGPGLCCATPQNLVQDQAIGTFNLPVFNGINQQGQWTFKDLNGDGRVCADCNEDRSSQYNAQPDLTFGFHNQLRWKKWQLNFLLRGALGQQMLNVYGLFHDNPNRLRYYNQFNIPAAAVGGELSRLTQDFSPLSDYFIENSSFVRLENIHLEREFRVQKIDLSVYVLAQNLFTLTNYSGLDPELRLNNVGNRLAPGIDAPNISSFDRDLRLVDRGRYPLTRGLMLGLKVNL